jgi:hypothetical protein
MSSPRCKPGSSSFTLVSNVLPDLNPMDQSDGCEVIGPCSIQSIKSLSGGGRSMHFPLESMGMKKAATVSQVLMVRPFCLKLSGSRIV